MKKLLSIILTVIVSVNLVLAGGGGGGSIFPITTGMTGTKPAKYHSDFDRIPVPSMKV